VKDWRHYISENSKALEEIDENLISKFFQVLLKTKEKGGKVWVLGNGGSASTASHAVADFGKTSKVLGARPLMTIAPSEMIALQTAYSNDMSFTSGFASTLADFAEQKDTVWIISVSGKSPNLILALEQAEAIGMTILSTVGSTGGALAIRSDVGIVVNSGDYQVVENAQLALMHWMTKLLARSGEEA
jgi:D-sedoheptulose 7-phosphate isomerase